MREMYDVGDTVLYGTEGVCKIERTENSFTDSGYVEYFVLRPVYNEKLTIYVPKKKEELLAKMQPVMTYEELQEMLRALPQEESIWIDDDGVRRQEFLRIVTTGDRRMLLRLIRTLHLHKKAQEARGRHLHQADEAVLKRAETLLHDEFAYVLHIQPEEVLPYILERIE